MRYERLQALVRDTVVSLIGTGGLINEIFIQKDLTLATALLCLAMVLFPAALGVVSLRAHSGGLDTTLSESPQPQHSQVRPSPESSTGASGDS